MLRTYNTLIIACNCCNQPREAQNVYRRMCEEGYHPNATTYNALISAYGKAGQLDKVMQVFQVRRGPFLDWASRHEHLLRACSLLTCVVDVA